MTRTPVVSALDPSRWSGGVVVSDGLNANAVNQRAPGVPPAPGGAANDGRHVGTVIAV
jgi:hypothetical protein